MNVLPDSTMKTSNQSAPAGGPDLQQLSVYVAGDSKFCGICLVKPTEARLIPNTELHLFQTIEPLTLIPPWLCVWCWARLRSFTVLRKKALRSQKFLLEIASTCLTEEKTKSFLEELDKIKSSSFATHVAEVMSLSVEPDVPMPAGQWNPIKQEPLELETSDDTCKQDMFPASSVYSDLDFKITDLEKTSEIEIEIKQEYNIDASDDPNKAVVTCAANKSEPTVLSLLKEKFAATKPVKTTRRRKKETRKAKQSFFKMFSTDPLPHIVKCIELSEEEMRRDHSVSLMKTVYLKASLKCAKCAIMFETEEAFDKHMTLHSPERGSLLCGVCERYDAQPEQHERHVRQHYRRVGCQLCDYTSRFRKLVIAHYVSAHTQGQFQCLYCDSDFAQKPTKLEEHVREEHRVKLVHKCKICRIYFWSPDMLGTHMRSHRRKAEKANRPSGEPGSTTQAPRRRDSYCATCQRELKDSASLVLHNNRVHNEDAWKFECDVCGKKFFSKYDMTIHIRGLHLGDGPKCPHCPKKFLDESRRNRHIAFVHLKIRHPKDKICEFCGRGFSKQHQLRDHRLVHTGERPHTCDTCGRAFAQASALATHVNHVHLRLARREYVRPSRGSGFHYPRNAAGEIYCEECDKTFQYKLGYSNHYKAHQRKNNT